MHRKWALNFEKWISLSTRGYMVHGGRRGRLKRQSLHRRLPPVRGGYRVSILEVFFGSEIRVHDSVNEDLMAADCFVKWPREMLKKLHSRVCLDDIRV